jgi:hypothetical protein
VITAVEALLLPTARLNLDQLKAVEKLLSQLDEATRTDMGRGGIDMNTNLNDVNVVAEVDLRLKAAGWAPQWTQMIGPHRFNAALQQIVGHRLQLRPSPDAYKEASKTLDTMEPPEAPASSLLSLS